MQNQCPKAKELLARLDAAVDIQETSGCCHAVKEVLESVFHSEDDFLPEEYMKPAEGSYARRLLHRDPRGRYTVLAMVWDKGQGTALHDHAGKWCVECVYRGKIKVTSYDLIGQEDDPVVQFKQEATVLAGVGEAGALIPPFEYHTIENALDTPAITIHVYGEELTWCNVFLPVDGGYTKVRKELAYTA